MTKRNKVLASIQKEIRNIKSELLRLSYIRPNQVGYVGDTLQEIPENRTVQETGWKPLKVSKKSLILALKNKTLVAKVNMSGDKVLLEIILGDAEMWHEEFTSALQELYLFESWNAKKDGWRSARGNIVGSSDYAKFKNLCIIFPDFLLCF